MFAEPVQLSIAPDYLKIIKQPMDLSTLSGKIENFEYESLSEFSHDLLLIPDNCMLYNQPSTHYYKHAQKFKKAALDLLDRATHSGILVNSVQKGGVLPFDIDPCMLQYGLPENYTPPKPKYFGKIKERVVESPKTLDNLTKFPVGLSSFNSVKKVSRLPPALSPPKIKTNVKRTSPSVQTAPIARSLRHSTAVKRASFDGLGRKRRRTDASIFDAIPVVDVALEESAELSRLIREVRRRR